MIRPEYEQKLFPFWTHIPVRFRDMDPLNHANNALFFTYFEEARIKFISGIPEFARGLEQGFSFVLVNANIDYLSEVTYPATLLIGTGVKRYGNTSSTTFQAIYRDDSKKLVSVCEATGVWYDTGEKRPARLPQFTEKEGMMLDDTMFTEDLRPNRNG